MVTIKDANVLPSYLFDQGSFPEKKLSGEFVRPRREKFIHENGLFALEC